MSEGRCSYRKGTGLLDTNVCMKNEVSLIFILNAYNRLFQASVTNRREDGKYETIPLKKYGLLIACAALALCFTTRSAHAQIAVDQNANTITYDLNYPLLVPVNIGEHLIFDVLVDRQLHRYAY